MSFGLQNVFDKTILTALYRILMAVWERQLLTYQLVGHLVYIFVDSCRYNASFKSDLTTIHVLLKTYCNMLGSSDYVYIHDSYKMCTLHYWCTYLTTLLNNR